MSETDHEEPIRAIAYRLWQEAGEPADRHDEFWHQARKQIEHPPEPPKSGTEDSFPASDPPSNTGIVGPGNT